ncbi:MAG TPA: ribonuclease HIII [Candidatus Onthovivens sp.]|nr:ribonuclease HIII [Candidatus Onthovivens sp.]
MITIKVDKTKLDEIYKTYKNNIIQENLGYILFVVQTPDFIITTYDNKKKTAFKVTIQGEDPMAIARKFDCEPINISKKVKIVKESPYYIDINQQIGSDEVGTGDFLGPIVVCAAYVDQETMKLVDELGINDSKKIKDTDIMRKIPMILNKCFYEVKVLSNEKYNNATKNGFNLNKIKAILHNHCLYRLHLKCPYVTNLYVDQFTPEDKYFEYIKDIEKKEMKIIFQEKGESYFPSIALASCIARYTFLKEIEFINKTYSVRVPLGASSKVKSFATAFTKKFGLNELTKICKTNFITFEEIKKDLSL